MSRRRISVALSSLLVVGVVLFSLTSNANAARPGGDDDGGGVIRRGIQLTGANVVPGFGDPTGAVTGEISFSKNQCCFRFEVASLAGRITHIGVYRGTAGTTGSEVIVLNPMPPGVMGLRGCVPADGALAREISRNKAGFYVMIVTDAYPGGAVRAQLNR